MLTRYQDVFKLTTLTAAINGVPFKPFRLGQLGWFEEQGIAQNTVTIERLNGSLSLVQTTPRNGPAGNVVTDDKPYSKAFVVPHMQVQSALMADELLGVRAFGSESTLDSVTMLRDRLLAKGRANLELTLEAHRLGALMGTILDADGSTLSNLFTDFGVTQQTQAMALTTAGTDVMTKFSEAVLKVEDKLGGVIPRGYRMLCGTTFFQTLRSHANVIKYIAPANTTSSPAAGAQNPLEAFVFAGVVIERYRGVTGCAIGDDDAYLIPEGVPGLFLTNYAPANYIETVNTIGLPMYAKAEEMGMGKGYNIEMQSNPLNLCTRPDCVIKCTKV